MFVTSFETLNRTRTGRRHTAGLIAAIVALALAGFSLPDLARAATQQVFASGLAGPLKIDATRDGAFVVSEQGSGHNDGRLSRVDAYGTVFPLLSGLPSGISPTGGPSGPSGVVVRNCCVVDLGMSEGDVLRFDGAPPREVPNPVASVSPLFSALLQLVFDRPMDSLTGSFALTPADHVTLTDGREVQLSNTAGEKLTVRLLADFKDFRPDPQINVRGSNPFGMTHSAKPFGTLLVDSGQNSVMFAGPIGAAKTLYRFPPIVNPPGVVPPVSDAVPTSIRHYQGSQFVVSLLTGSPFLAGSASLRLFDVDTQSETVLLPGLTTVTDVLILPSGIYVLELSTNMNAGEPGRLLHFSDPGAEPTIIASGLLGASGMTYSPKDDAIFIAEVYVGRITRVDL